MKKLIVSFVANNSSDDGFSLVEVMIALVVLLVGMLGVMGMQYYAITGNTSSRDMRMATNLNQQLVEQIMSTPYDSLASSTDQPLLGEVNTSLTGGLTNITRTWWVVPDCVALCLNPDDNTCNPALGPSCSSDPEPGVTTGVSAIRVRTCWTDKDGTNHSMTFDTLRTVKNDVL